MPPVIQDFTVAAGESATITVVMTPPLPVGGRNAQVEVFRRFNGVYPIMTKSFASGFYGVSGMNIVNSGQGVMSMQINGVDTSGWAPGAYAYLAQLLDSPPGTATEGYMVLTP
jgi:hypothetical protein